MFLLIHRPARWSCTANDFTFHYVSINTEKTCTLGWAQNYFTFHYVSINTKTKKLYHASHTPLHSNMFLLIPVPRFPEAHPHRTLHSNMFLLILDGTFIDHLGSLHSNMFLLIHDQQNMRLYIFQTLHSNMFLLIPRSSEPPINSSILYHILSTMVFFYLFIYFDITRFTGSTILLMFFTFVDLS